MNTKVQRAPRRKNELPGRQKQVVAGQSGAGNEHTRPRRELPPGACDCHMHVLGPLKDYRYEVIQSLNPPEALWEAYAAKASAIGLTRCVIVQPSVYGANNRCTLDAVTRSGNDSVAVVVVMPDVTHRQLSDMHARGARAVRLQTFAAGGMPLDALESIAKKIRHFGWHIEVYLDTQDLPGFADRLRRLEVPIVFDHMGQWLEGDRTEERGFRMLLQMLESGQAWVKLSNPRFPPSASRARQLISANPERVLWGSDWPHISYQGPVPNENELLNQLTDWISDDSSWLQILVTNPTSLYFQQR